MSFIHSLSHSVQSVVRFIQSCREMYCCPSPFISCSFTHPCLHIFIHCMSVHFMSFHIIFHFMRLVHSFVHTCIYPNRSFIHAFIHAFIHVNHSFIRLCSHSFLSPFINSCIHSSFLQSRLRKTEKIATRKNRETGKYQREKHEKLEIATPKNAKSQREKQEKLEIAKRQTRKTRNRHSEKREISTRKTIKTGNHYPKHKKSRRAKREKQETETRKPRQH